MSESERGREANTKVSTNWHPIASSRKKLGTLVLKNKNFGPFLGQFRVFALSFYGFFRVFWEVPCKIKQNDARESKNMQNSAKIHQNDAT